MHRSLHVLIVDDHAIIRRGIGQILQDAPIEEVGEAATPQEALDMVRARTWDVVVLDVGLPGRGGIEVLRDIKTEFPKLPVLILSMHPEEQYAVRALRAGASGYLTKDSAPEQLVDAVRRVATGGRYISPTLADRLADELVVDTARPVHETLSNREFEVLKRLGNGETVSEIARDLALSVKTISGYRANIRQKTGLANNAAMMRYVLEKGLLD